MRIIGTIIAFVSLTNAPDALAQQTTAYEYDALGRLVGAVSSAGNATTYQYDAAGNRALVTYVSSALDPIDWASANSSTTGTVGAVFTNYQSIAGGSGPITLRFSATYSGNLTAGSFNVYSATRTMFLGTIPLGSGSIDVSINPNESVNLYADAASPASQGTGVWNVSVTNQSAEGAAVDTANLSATVNIPDYTLDPIAFANAANYPNDGTGNATVTNGGGYASGINRPISMHAVVSPIYRGGTANSYFTVYVGAGSASWNIGDTSAKTFSWTTNPGDFVAASAALSQFNAGDAWAYWHVDVFNSATGEYVGGYDGGLTSTR